MLFEWISVRKVNENNPARFLEPNLRNCDNIQEFTNVKEDDFNGDRDLIIQVLDLPPGYSNWESTLATASSCQLGSEEHFNRPFSGFLAINFQK